MRSRGTSNANQRGNSRDRARRRRWLVEHYGDGELVACFLQISRHCLYVLDEHTVSADRIDPGGSYRRSNIQPACGPCQCRQGGLIGAARAHGLDTPRRQG
jgi:hypothetical protein